MRSDFDMIVQTFPKREDITIIPVSDVHIGAQECNMSAWQSFCKSLVDVPNTYIVIVGDIVNNATKTSVSNVYEETIRPRDQKKLAVEMLTPVRDKILAMVGGNHEARTAKDADQDIMYDIANKLDLEDTYRENLAFLKIKIGDNRSGNGSKNPVYTIGITHGNGSSIYTSASAVRAERFGMAIDGIDALIVGHTHKPMNVPVAKIGIDQGRNKAFIKQFRLIVSTSWLDYASYAARKLLAPTSFMLQEVRLCGKKKEIKVTG